MYVQRDHPMLRGCRFFWSADQDSRGTTRNVLAGGPLGTVTGCTPGRSDGHRALVMNGSTDQVTWGNVGRYGLRHAAMTVIARARVVGDNGETGQLQGVVSSKDADASSSTGGFALYWIKDTFTNPGFNFTLYGHGGFYYTYSGVGGSGEYGRDRILAGVFDPKVNIPRVWVDGTEYTNNGNNGVSSPGTQDWNVAVAAALGFGYIVGDSGLHFNGALAWVALFDRALSRQEIRRWGRDNPLPFLLDEDPLQDVSGTTYRSVINVPGPYSGVGGSGIQYVTSLDALAYVGGDVTVDPATGESAAYVNVVDVGQAYLGREADILVRYVNKTNVGQVVHLYPSVKYANLVRVFQRSRKLVDGRADILSAGRYRR